MCLITGQKYFSENIGVFEEQWPPLRRRKCTGSPGWGLLLRAVVPRAEPKDGVSLCPVLVPLPREEWL